MNFMTESTNVLEILDKILSSDKDNLFLHFSQFPKFGMKLTSWSHGKYPTPAAIYTYPIKKSIEKYGKNLAYWPYASNARYIFIMKISPNAKILDLSEASKEDLKNFIMYLLKTWNFTFDEMKNAKNEMNPKYKIPGEIIWQLSRNLSSKKGGDFWNRILVNYGYDIVIDSGLGIIHPNEPVQAAILNTSIITSYKMFENPYSIETSGKKEESYLKKLSEIFAKYLLYEEISENELTPIVNYLYSYYSSYPHFDFSYEEIQKKVYDKLTTTKNKCEKLEKIIEIFPSEFFMKNLSVEIRKLPEETKKKIFVKYNNCNDFSKIKSLLI